MSITVQVGVPQVIVLFKLPKDVKLKSSNL